MQPGPCVWFLLELEDGEFAIQYEGPNPKTEFPADLEGKFLILIYTKIQPLIM